MKGNDFVALMLRSPLHALMGNTMLITVRGRRTGRPITTPVSYIRRDSELWVVSTRIRKWWRNAAGGTQVSLRLHGRDAAGLAELVTDEGEVAAGLREYVRQAPVSARALHIRVAGGVPDEEDLRCAAREHLFVKICTRTGVA